MNKKFLKFIAFFIFFIFFLNFIAEKFHLYYSLWYFDMIMHFLGGAWLGIFFVFIFNIKELSFKNFLKIFFGVLFIGVLWELFEIVVNDALAKNPLNLSDILSDLFFDLFGGFSMVYLLNVKFLRKFKNDL